MDEPSADRTGPPIRILFATDAIRDPITGVGRMALTLLRELRALGHEVIALDWQVHPQVAEVADRVAVVPCRLPWARTALWHLELLRRMPGVAPAHDVLLDPTGYPNVWGHHPRLAIVVHDLHMLQPGCYRAFKHAWFRLCLRRGVRNAALVICPSSHTRNAVMTEFDLPAERCVVVPNALDPSFGAAGSAGERGGYFLAVGTIETRKNILRLLDAFADCRGRGVTERLVLAGRSGHGADEVRRRIAADDLREAVDVRTGVDDEQLRRLYRGATGLLFPSLDEGFGLPILEAMASETPVVTSRISATAEVAGDAALLVNPLDVADIGDAIRRLSGDPQLREELRRRGLARVRQFDAPGQAAAYAERLSELAPAGQFAPN